MTYPNDPYSVEPRPDLDRARMPDDAGGGGLYALIGAAVIAAMIVVAFVVGAFETDQQPTGAVAPDRPAVTQPADPQAGQPGQPGQPGGGSGGGAGGAGGRAQ